MGEEDIVWVSDRPDLTNSTDRAPLARELALLRATLGHCPKYIAVISRDGRLLGYNRRFRKLFDEPPGIGSRAEDLFEETDRELLREVLASAAHADPAAALLQMRTVSSRAVDVFAATLPNPDDASGAPLGIVASGDDKTEELTERVERDRLARAFAEDNERAAFELATAMLAHDVSNALAVVMLALDGMRLANEEEREDCRSEAMTAAAHARELLARAKERRLNPRWEEQGYADLGEAFRNVAALARHRAPHGHRARVIIETPPEPWCVAIQPHALLQVLSNLVTNAIQAVDESGHRGTVRVSGERSDGSVVLRVRDEGTGIEPERLPLVFDAYETSKKATGGEGLGLAITRQLVEKAGGNVRVVSRLGEGTEFLVTLQVHPSSEVRSVAAAVASDATANVVAAGGRKT